MTAWLKSPKVVVTLAIILVAGWVGLRVLLPRAQLHANHLKEQITLERNRVELLGEMQQQRGRSDALAQYLAPGSNDWLIQTVLAHAAAAKLRVAEITPQPDQLLTSVSLRQRAVRLSATAETYHQVVTFIGLCERHHERIRVDALELRSEGDPAATDRRVLTLQVTLTTFADATGSTEL